MGIHRQTTIISITETCTLVSPMIITTPRMVLLPNITIMVSRRCSIIRITSTTTRPIQCHLIMANTTTIISTTHDHKFMDLVGQVA